MVVLSLALYAWTPWWWWSLFANLVTPLAAIALFVGEHVAALSAASRVRARTLDQALQAYRTHAGGLDGASA